MGLGTMRQRTFQELTRGSQGWRRRSPTFLPFIISILLFLPSATLAQEENRAKDDEPKLLSVFPSVGRRGSTLRAEVRGNSLQKAYAVWFDTGNINAKIRTPELVKDEVQQRLNFFDKKEGSAVFRAEIEIEIPPTTLAGFYRLRLVCPRGLSNPVRFHVVEEPVAYEKDSPHQSLEQAQPVLYPVVIGGELARPGELDYYSFQARRGEELSFEVIQAEKAGRVIASDKFAPRLALYEEKESWFDTHRHTRLLFEEERSSDLIPVESVGTYRFKRDGQFFLEVSGLYGEGCPDCAYELRIAPRQAGKSFDAGNDQFGSAWKERSFDRRLKDAWLHALEARTVEGGIGLETGVESADTNQANGTGPSTVQESTHVPSILSQPAKWEEQEPNDDAAHAQPITIPGIVEGTIDRPGDVDSFRFTVKPSTKLAFEFETPDTGPPQFNPRFSVIDSQDRELFSNVRQCVAVFSNNADKPTYLKDVEPKTVYTFENGGDYILQVRDITSRYGGPSDRYRILIRPQIPHVGEVSVSDVDHMNLVRGEAKKISVTLSYEEGFRGDVSLLVAGLPQGVQASPGVEPADDREPTDVDKTPDLFVPKLQKATIVLLAGPSAPLTSTPSLVRIQCRPILNGKPGEILPVADIPLMVVEGARQEHEEQEKPGN